MEGTRQNTKAESTWQVMTSAQEKDTATVDWRGRASNPNKHGGMRAALFVLGLQAFEIMAIAAVGNNLITYVINEMHYSLSKSANIVTNFVGTIFLLALFGGYLSDSFLGSFWTMLIFGFIELSHRNPKEDSFWPLKHPSAFAGQWPVAWGLYKSRTIPLLSYSYPYSSHIITENQ
ncbi:hypothetical protein SLEP1_g53687 [Rubroshorea leprosula]|uniref:Uncharacterized protein n=1 Tax=Rubroshorea leprosula TaxID=152421 RepID=A0AAV5MB89_9ROSI|nr:hypothetical protein SLEP1_g53687 [Rubroshorea leprosula]